MFLYITDSQANAAACSAVEFFRHVDITPFLYRDEELWQSARETAEDAARLASPALQLASITYLNEDRGYRRVVIDCQQVSYGQ